MTSTFLPAIIILLLFQLAGEILSRALGLPVPGPVLGMVGLCIALQLSPRLGALVRPTGTGLLAHLSLLFVPAGVGVVANLPTLRADGLALAVSLMVSTALAIAVGAVVFEKLARASGLTDDEEAGQ